MALSRLAAQLEEIEQKIASIGSGMMSMNAAVESAAPVGGPSGDGGGGGGGGVSGPANPTLTIPDVTVRHEHTVRNLDREDGRMMPERPVYLFDPTGRPVGQPINPPGTDVGRGFDIGGGDVPYGPDGAMHNVNGGPRVGGEGETVFDGGAGLHRIDDAGGQLVGQTVGRELSRFNDGLARMGGCVGDAVEKMSASSGGSGGGGSSGGGRYLDQSMAGFETSKSISGGGGGGGGSSGGGSYDSSTASGVTASVSHGVNDVILSIALPQNMKSLRAGSMYSGSGTEPGGGGISVQDTADAVRDGTAGQTTALGQVVKELQRLNTHLIRTSKDLGLSFRTQGE